MSETVLQFIVDASSALMGSLDYATTLQTIARFALPALGDWCAVDLLDAHGRIQRAAVACADRGDEALARQLKHEFPLQINDDHPVAAVIRTGSVALLRDMRLLERGAPAAAGRLAPTTLLSLPLAIGQAIVGSLTFAFARPGREYGIEELELANAYAKPAARALEHARRFQTERLGRQRAERAIDYAARFQRVAAGLTSALTASQVAEVILSEGLPALEAQAGSVCLLTDDKTELEVLQSRGYDEAVIARWRRFPVSGRALLADVVRSKKPEFLSSRAQRARRYPSAAADYGHLPYQSWAALPLIVDGKVIGGIGLSFVEARSWSAADRRFMETLGHQCAQALERARLYEAEAKARQRAVLYQDQLIVLATASVMLNASLEFEPTLSNVCQFMVAHLADWAAVLLLDPASPSRPR
ncbi:MAG TPA: GAF domain-containing protein, partial [Herpetosiphonaceae bacterium]